MTKIIEICCSEPEAVKAALEGGATRIELCSGLDEGGITPSFSLTSFAVASGILEVNVLIRPRPGNFHYTEDELSVMNTDIIMAQIAGATGIVIGALTPEGNIDKLACRKMIAMAKMNAAIESKPQPYITFHRAFDVCKDPLTALEDVIDLGCDCLLTSGTEATAEEGIPMLKRLVEAANGRIRIIAGSGVNPDNAGRIIAETGVDGVHSSARKPIKSSMQFVNDKPGFGEDRLATSSDVVATLIHNLELRIEN